MKNLIIMATCLFTINAFAKEEILKYRSIEFKLNSEVLDSEQRQLVQDIHMGRNSFLSTTNLFYSQNFIQYRSSPDAQKVGYTDISQKFDSLLMGLDRSLQADKIQKRSQENLIGINGNLAYNRAYANPFNLLIENRLNCNSGTVLQILLGRQIMFGDGRAYLAKNPVTIFSSGHVQNGFIKMETVNNKSIGRIVGVESTILGLGRINYDFVDKSDYAIRVVDTDLWVLASILGKNNAILNADEVALNIQIYTANIHGFDLAKMEEAIQIQQKIKDETANDKKSEKEKAVKEPKFEDAASNLFSFGFAKVPPGDMIMSDTQGDEYRTAAVGRLPELKQEYQDIQAAKEASLIATIEQALVLAQQNAAAKDKVLENENEITYNTFAVFAIMNSLIQGKSAAVINKDLSRWETSCFKDSYKPCTSEDASKIQRQIQVCSDGKFSIQKIKSSVISVEGKSLDSAKLKITRTSAESVDNLQFDNEEEALSEFQQKPTYKFENVYFKPLGIGESLGENCIRIGDFEKRVQENYVPR